MSLPPPPLLSRPASSSMSRTEPEAGPSNKGPESQLAKSTDRVPVAFTPPKRRTGGSIKGKERADAETTELTVVTYRHLLGRGTGGPANPLRVCAHIDIDAAWAAMEMARLGLDPETPFALKQWSSLIAVNYPARAYGISRFDTLSSALQKCPHLVLLHCATYRIGDTEPGYYEDARARTHKISLDPYRRESAKIVKIFGEFCPVVEKASTDESFLDLTLSVRAKLLERYPTLARIPEGADMDTPLPSPQDLHAVVDWDSVGNLIPITGQKKETAGTTLDGRASVDDQAVAQTVQELEADTDPEEPPLTWSDVALYIGAEIVLAARTAVHERLGYTASAGTAPNKMLAKLCSAWKKPNSQTVLRPCAIPAFLNSMPIQKLRNLGGKLGGQVADIYDATTVGELLDISLPDLQSKFGDDSGTWLWELIRGRDYSEVENKTEVKSMLASKNFFPPLSRFAEVCHWLQMLAADLQLRLLEAREEFPGLWPKTLTLSWRSESTTKSKQAPFPYTSRLDLDYITQRAIKLVRAAVGERLDVIGPDSVIGSYGTLQLGFNSLERLEEGQGGIREFFTDVRQPSVKPVAAVAAAARSVPQQVDSSSECVPVGKKRRRDHGSNEEDTAPRMNDVQGTHDELDRGGQLDKSSPQKWARPVLPSTQCPRCSETITISPHAISQLQLALECDPGTSRSQNNVVVVEAALRKARDEHADWHFARDMLEEERKKDWAATSSTTTTTKEKKKKKQRTNEVAAGAPLSKGQASLNSFFK